VGSSIKKTGRKRGILIPLLMLPVILTALSSCSEQNVLIIIDPYIRLVDGDSWAPGSRMFRIKAAMNGFKTTLVSTDAEKDLKTVLSEYSKQADIVILSPWNAQFLDEVPEMDGRFIIAGGYPPDKMPAWLESKMTVLVPDRLAVMRELGQYAAEYAELQGLPVFALFKSETYRQRKEMELLLQSFPDREKIIIRDVNSGVGENQLPADYYRITGEASILLLFAGVLNIEALSSSDESLLPVITESIKASGAWHDRIVASVEDNPEALGDLLLSEMKSGSDEDVRYYPAKLSKGVLFGSVSR